MGANTDAAIAALRKKYGDGSIGWLGEVRSALRVTGIPTGSIGLDLALNCGGLPKGRISELFGVESCGKTTLALHIIANVQRSDGRAAAFIDAEHALDPEYCAGLGVDLDHLLLCQPDTAEQALDTADALVRTGEFDLIVIDSVAGLVPKVEIDGAIGDAQVGVKARLMSKACRVLTEPVKTNDVALLFINQVRSQIGGFAGTVTPGGWGLKFAASVRIKLNQTKGGRLKDGDEDNARRIQATVVKSKVGPPFRTAEFDIVYGEGIVFERDLLIQGIRLKIVKQNGSWISFDGEQVGQGLSKATQALKGDPALASRIQMAIVQGIDSE